MSQRTLDVHRLEEIQVEIEELVREAKKITDDYPETGGRPDAYWLPHVIGALRNDHEWCGGSMSTLEDSIREIMEGEEEE